MSLLLLLGGAGVVPISSGVAGPGGTTIHIEWSPTTEPLDDPVWVDISDQVRVADGVSVTRGRSYELDDFQTGSASFTLDNRGRLFDPAYSGGAYFGNLKPMRQFRILVEYESVVYSRFNGFISGWPQRYDISKREATVPVQLYDAFWMFSQSGLAENGFIVGDEDFGVVGTSRVGGGVAGTEELSGARVDTVLDLDGWPAAWRDIDSGNSLVAAQDAVDSGDPLGYMKKVETSEDGYLFVSRNGDVTFLGRHARYTVERMSTSQAAFSDDGSSSSYSAFGSDLDLDRVFNDVRFTREDGAEQNVEDATSRNAYRRRTRSASGLLLTTDAEVRQLALSYLHRYKDPTQRLPQMRIPIMAAPTTMFPDWLPRELLDRVTVEHTPVNVGSQQSFDVVLEGYTETFDSKTYTVAANFSPYFNPGAFIVGDPVLGLVGTGVVVY